MSCTHCGDSECQGHLSTNSLFYLSISVEPLKSSGPAQCFSCQRFGHGSRNCGYPLRCVKCAGNHSASACTKTLEQTPTCCNCGGPHTANFRGCPHLLSLRQQQLAQPASKISETPTPNMPPISTPSINSHSPPPKPQTHSYAAATSGQPPQPQNYVSPQINLPHILSLLTNLLAAIAGNQDPKSLIEATIKTFLTMLSPQNG